MGDQRYQSYPFWGGTFVAASLDPAIVGATARDAVVSDIAPLTAKDNKGNNRRAMTSTAAKECWRLDRRSLVRPYLRSVSWLADGQPFVPERGN